MQSSNHLSVTVECPVLSSFAVDQVRGMFDLAKEKVAKETFNVELPSENEDWQVGVIVGPSGSGKSTVARHAYGKKFVEGFRWDKDKAVVDHFPDISIKDVTATLTAVGFSSPPSWVKPHHVLSGGERFRCDLARALLAPGNLVAFDEFTSVVDRTVAKIGSAAVAKSIRKGRIAKRFVAVTCHYDVLEWLEPDWVLDMASGQLARGSLWQRPAIKLEVAPIHRGAWQLFRRHHYLNTNLHTMATCFAAFWSGEPVAFSAWVPRLTRTRRANDMREHRTVVLPDFQGVGIGNRLSELCASIFVSAGGRAFSTTSHPGMIHYRSQSPKWRTVRFGMASPVGESGLMKRRRQGKANDLELARLESIKRAGRRSDSAGRVTGGFQYVGPSISPKQAEAMLSAVPRVFGDDTCERVLAVIADGGLFRTINNIAARSGIAKNKVASAILRLLKTGEVSRERFGGRWGYVAAKRSSC